MTSFAELAAHRCPPHGGLALSLAAELGEVDAVAAEAALDALAATLAVARHGTPREQLGRSGREVAARLRARVRLGTIDDLLLDRALLNAVGDPVCWAIACVEAAGRAGIPLGVVADAEDHVLVAHRGLGPRCVVDPRAPRSVLDAADLPASGELTWRGPHETALMLLDRVVARAERTGRHGVALRAARLRLELPLDEPVLARLRDEAARIATRLN